MSKTKFQITSLKYIYFVPFKTRSRLCESAFFSPWNVSTSRSISLCSDFRHFQDNDFMEKTILVSLLLNSKFSISESTFFVILCETLVAKVVNICCQFLFVLFHFTHLSNTVLEDVQVPGDGDFCRGTWPDLYLPHLAGQLLYSAARMRRSARIADVGAQRHFNFFATIKQRQLQLKLQSEVLQRDEYLLIN